MATRKTTPTKDTLSGSSTMKKSSLVAEEKNGHFSMNDISSIGLEKFKDEIEKKAGEIHSWRIVSGIPGDALSDWLAAEKEIATKHMDTSALNGLAS